MYGNSCINTERKVLIHICPLMEIGRWRRQCVFKEGLVESSSFLTLKEPGFLDPSHSRGGPKISKTDWRNIKCVVLVDSYDPPESIGTKKSTNIPCMTPQWRHKWRHVKNTKITKKSPKSWFFAIFSSKVAFFGNDVCQSMLTYVLTPNKPNK